MSGKKFYAFDEIDVDRIAKVVRASESGGSTPPSTPFGHEANQRRPDRLRFRNDYSGTVPAWGLMRVTGTTTIQREFFYTTNRPDATYRWLYIVNGPNDIATGKIGWCTRLFVEGHVLYDTGATPAYGERWGPKADSFLLWQHRPGFFIMGGTTGSGATSRVIALQIPPGEVRLQNDSGGAVAAGGSATLGIYGGAAGTTDTGLEVTVTNGSSTSWATTKYGWATADAGGLIFGAPHQT